MLEQDGHHARVRVRYPLDGHKVDAVLRLQRRGGRWYLSDYLQHAERGLATGQGVERVLPPPPSMADSAAPAPR